MTGTRRVHTNEETSMEVRCRIPPKKRIKKIDVYDHFDSCIELYNALRSAKDTNGQLVSDLFLRTPSRRADPDYYNKIERPIDFSRIQQKIKSGDYMSFKEFCSDIELLISNVQLFYEENSIEQNYAQILFQLYKTSKDRILQSDCSSSTSISTPSRKNKNDSPTPSSYSKSSEKRTPTPSQSIEEWRMEAVIVSLIHLTDSDNRLICPPFRLLDPPEEFPDYYQKIKEPIDLKTICKRIRSRSYSTWISLEDDIRLMCRNAQEFNLPDSKIYQDADTLLNHFQMKMRQMAESHKLSSKEISINTQHIDSLIRSTDSEANEFTEDSEEDEDSEHDHDPNSYPDYYEEIEHPMSLFMINKKLKRGVYPNIKELVSDLILMFDNACLYNMEQSPIFRSSQKLKALTLETLKQLEQHSVSTITMADDQMLSDNCIIKITDKNEFDHQLKNNVDVESIIIPSTSQIKQELDINTDIKAKPKRRRRPPGAPPGKRGRPPKNRSEDVQQNVSIQTKELPAEKDAQQLIVKNARSRISKTGRKSLEENKEYIQKLMHVWTTVRDLKIGERLLSEPFFYLPCDKTYPDYYTTIKNPIDLTKIAEKIKQSKYKNPEEMMSDFRLMFSNAREYNMPNSQIYSDSTILESVAFGAMSSIASNNIQHLPERSHNSSNEVKYNENSINKQEDEYSSHEELSNDHVQSPCKRGDSPDYSISDEILSLLKKSDKRLEYLSRNREQEQMQSIFDELLLFRDEDQRILSEWFISLPTEDDEFYGEYYKIIKKPIDLTRIASKLNSNQYDSWRQLISDLKLVFENACKFNEPESQIYKDSSILLSELMHLKSEFFQDNDIQSVQVQVRQILHQLLDFIENYTDSYGIKLIDSIKSIKDFGHGDVANRKYYTIEEIRANLVQGRYRRLDRFQDDIFSFFSWCRANSEIDSKTFIDSIELQKYYINRRDELCKGVLISPALLYVSSLFEEELQIERREKKRRFVSEEINNSERRLEDEAKPDAPIINSQTEKIVAESNNESESCMLRPVSPLDIVREEVLLQRQPVENDLSENPSCSFGNVYYQQIEHNGRFYRLGDGALVYRKEKPYCDIIRIDKLWKTISGEKMFSGSRFARPNECRHEPSRLFYRREVFGVKEVDVVDRIENIQERCAILTLKQAESCRPTEIPECDIFIVDQKVLGHAKFDNDKNLIPITNKNCSIIVRYGENFDEFDTHAVMDLDNAKPLRKLKSCINTLTLALKSYSD